MPVTRSFENNFELQDYTEELLLIPNQWGLINELGIFRNEAVTQHSVIVESSEGTLGLIKDRVRGERNTVNRNRTRTTRSFPIPHFPLDDRISPEDIQGKRAYNSADGVETVDAVRMRKMEDLRNKHAATLEYARAVAITTGDIYAPNGSVAANYYTDFGVSQESVDLILGTGTTDVKALISEAVNFSQDNIKTGDLISGYTVLCDTTMFDKLTGHATVQEAFKYYTSTQEPLREGLRSGWYRRFVYNNVEFIEYRGSYLDEDGTSLPLIPAGNGNGQGFLIPRGTRDTFITYFSPANKMDLVNTLGEEAYLFEYMDRRNSGMDIESESNFLNLIRRPQAIVKLTSSN